MPYILSQVLQFLIAVFISLNLFVSAWIVLPPPNMFLVKLAVGAPEVSPWLIALNGIATWIVAIFMRRSPWQAVFLSASLLALFFSTLPLLQFPHTNQRFAHAMRSALGKDYLERIPSNIAAGMRKQPLVLLDSLGGMPADKCRIVENIPFATKDGVELRMNVYQPPQPGKYPTIVAIYGGAWQRGKPNDYARFSSYMAARGYTVFAIDYRHAPQHRFPAHIEDVATALNFIQKHGSEYDADLTGIAIMGSSAGAHLAMLAAYQGISPLPIKAVVDYYGPIDLPGGYDRPPFPDPIDNRDVLRKFLGGTPAEFPELYRQASPINYIREGLPPTLIVHGQRDNIVEFTFARAFHQKLIAPGNTAVFLDIPWAEHAFDAVFHGISNQLALYYTERFLAWALH
jgi:acetyl esterase/lipase